MVKLLRFFSALFVSILLLFFLCLSGCKDKKLTAAQKAQSKTSIAVAVNQSHVTKLYYKGLLLPLRATPVLSPVDGIVNGIYFEYGQKVQKGANLVSIRATKLAETFRTTVSDFLQKKAAMQTQKTKYEGDKALYEAGVISKQDYSSSGDSYATSVLNFNQSRLELLKILEQLDISPNEIVGLELSDTPEVVKLLKQSISTIMVVAPETGVVLIPTQSKTDSAPAGEDGGSASGAGGELLPGAETKAQQALVSLGDLSGYRVHIQVSELDIVRIRPGLPALITGDAYPGIVLKGEVRQIAIQANPSQQQGQSGVSMFDALIVIPKADEKAQALIRVGMTAKVEIKISNPPEITIPINAVVSKEGVSTVTIIDSKTGQPRKVVVETGPTTETGVTILKGVKAGDKVVVHHGAGFDAAAN